MTASVFKTNFGRTATYEGAGNVNKKYREEAPRVSKAIHEILEPLARKRGPFVFEQTDGGGKLDAELYVHSFPFNYFVSKIPGYTIEVVDRLPRPLGLADRTNTYSLLRGIHIQPENTPGMGVRLMMSPDHPPQIQLVEGSKTTAFINIGHNPLEPKIIREAESIYRKIENALPEQDHLRTFDDKYRVVGGDWGNIILKSDIDPYALTPPAPR